MSHAVLRTVSQGLSHSICVLVTIDNAYSTHTGSHTVSQDTAYSTHMGTRTVSQVASQPERVVRIVDDDVKTVTIAGGGGAYATKSWKEGAVKVDIVGYVSNMELKDVELVSVSFADVFSVKLIVTELTCFVASIVSHKAYDNSWVASIVSHKTYDNSWVALIVSHKLRLMVILGNFNCKSQGL